MIQFALTATSLEPFFSQNVKPFFWFETQLRNHKYIHGSGVPMGFQEKQEEYSLNLNHHSNNCSIKLHVFYLLYSTFLMQLLHQNTTQIELLAFHIYNVVFLSRLFLLKCLQLKWLLVEIEGEMIHLCQKNIWCTDEMR